MNIIIKKVSSREEIDKCMEVRIKVFVEGQNVPFDEEVDGKDKDSDHYLLLLDDQPAGVTRVRFSDDYAKIERVAVLDEHQGKGLGKALMQKILADLKKNMLIRTAKLSAQTYAIPFYEKLGFVVCSEEYMDANIPHKDMSLSWTSLDIPKSNE
jgi:predicted GNAT family N-acyltransferase